MDRQYSEADINLKLAKETGQHNYRIAVGHSRSVDQYIEEFYPDTHLINVNGTDYYSFVTPANLLLLEMVKNYPEGMAYVATLQD